MRPRPQIALYLVVVFTTLALYFPCRLIADSTNATMIGSNDFAYPSATLLWPIWSFLLTFVADACGLALGYSQRFRLCVLPLLFIAWFLLPSIPVAMGIGGGGDLGIRCFSGEALGWNTTSVSFVLCLIAFLAGAVAGEILGRRWTRRDGSKRAT